MSEIHVAVGSYVVNALDETELQAFESHLAVCDTCQREVLEFSETAAHLASLVEVAPPPALRASVLTAIKEVRPLPPELPDEAPVTTPGPRRAAVALVDEPAPVTDELARRRGRRGKRLLTLVAAAALVVALALGGWVVGLRQQRETVVADATLMNQLLSAPDVEVHATTMPDGTRVSFAASKSLNRAALVGDELAVPAHGKTYQLWTVRPSGAVPDRTFSQGGTARAWFSGDVRSAIGLALSMEPSGGSQQPTAPILATTKI